MTAIPETFEGTTLVRTRYVGHHHVHLHAPRPYLAWTDASPVTTRVPFDRAALRMNRYRIETPKGIYEWFATDQRCTCGLIAYTEPRRVTPSRCEVVWYYGTDGCKLDYPIPLPVQCFEHPT